MANIWMTRDEMTVDSAILPASFNAKYLDRNNEYVDCVYEKNDVLQNRVGVGDTTCDMTWWESGDLGFNNRFVAQYLASNITNLPDSASTRRISVDIPVYMRNVKYLDICFCVWIDLGFARGTSLSGYNEVSFYTYTKSKERLQGYCIPTAGNDHPGTGRLSIQGSPGFIPFRFLYDDEENPVDIDFISLEFSGAYSEQNQLNIWISQPCYNEDIEFANEPQPEPDDPGDWGDPSEKTGGHGTFTAVSDNSGDGTGTHAAQITQNWNTASAVAGNFYNLYRFNGPDDQALLEFASNLWGANFIESFLNSLVNPLSAIVSFHLIPEKFAPSVTGVTKRIYAGIKNLSTTTARTFKDLMATYHFGPYNFDQFYDGFGDFEPYTELYIHLPYVGVYPIDLSACMGGQLSVDYYCDRLTGDCAAIVWVKDKYGNYRTRYEYKGNCARPLPIAQYSSSAAMGFAQGTLGMITSAVGFATGNPSLAATGATQVGSSIPQLMNNKFTVSNVSQGGATTPSDTTIYLIVVRKLWNNPNKYQNLIGLPSDVSGTINSSDYNQAPFTGFLSVRMVDVDALDATDEEKTEIVSLMTEGIYV